MYNAKSLQDHCVGILFQIIAMVSSLNVEIRDLSEIRGDGDFKLSIENVVTLP